MTAEPTWDDCRTVQAALQAVLPGGFEAAEVDIDEGVPDLLLGDGTKMELSFHVQHPLSATVAHIYVPWPMPDDLRPAVVAGFASSLKMTYEDAEFMEYEMMTMKQELMAS